MYLGLYRDNFSLLIFVSFYRFSEFLIYFPSLQTMPNIKFDSPDLYIVTGVHFEARHDRFLCLSAHTFLRFKYFSSF